MLGLIVGGFATYELATIGFDMLKKIHYDEQGRIYGIDEVARAIRIVYYDFKYCDDELYYYINIKTKEFWALFDEYGNWNNDENIIVIDPSHYIMNPERATVEQLEIIRDMIIKKYTLYKDTAREQKPKNELCSCGMFYN